ncbi:hypothetical protein MMC21_003649 [Puttea exsequens]|nr:hypothetical protein [Puttea exsequens]
MSFDALPNELIYHISQRVQPPDLESYVSSNHRIREIAHPIVEEHRQLKAKYTKINLTHIAAAELLYEICYRPWIALYPQSVQFQSNKAWRTFENPRNRRDRAELERVMIKSNLVDDEDVRDMIGKSGLVPRHEMGPWLNELGRGDEDCLFASLLACLPNIERLVIRSDDPDMERVKTIVRSVKAQPSNSGCPRALSKLSDARVLGREGSSSCDLEIFPLLASIPTIKILHGRNLVGAFRECYRDGWLSYPGASPEITHIYLETCGMSVEGLDVLCSSIKALRSFKYVAHRPKWGLHGINDVLKNARHSLEELVLSTSSGEGRFIGTLRKFTALKTITVDSSMFVSRATRQMQRAVDVLPASIETATLAGNGLTPAQEERFLSDLYRPSFHYPNLKALYVDDSWGKRNIGKDRLKFQKEFHKQTSSSWMLRYR